MKITALLVLRCTGDSDPVILAKASDVSHFGHYQRSSVKEFIVFFGRTVASHTPQGQRQSVQYEEYKVHAYNRNGLCALGFMDDHYPVRSAFSLLNQHKTIDSVLAQGEELDSLVEKSSDLSVQTKLFYNSAKKTKQSCTSHQYPPSSLT